MSVTDAIVFIFSNLFWATIVVLVILIKDNKTIGNIFPHKTKPEDDPDRYADATNENILDFFNKTNQAAKDFNNPIPVSEVVASSKPKEPEVE